MFSSRLILKGRGEAATHVCHSGVADHSLPLATTVPPVAVAVASGRLLGLLLHPNANRIEEPKHPRNDALQGHNNAIKMTLL
jgi:hypothetical protein